MVSDAVWYYLIGAHPLDCDGRIVFIMQSLCMVCVCDMPALSGVCDMPALNGVCNITGT